MVDCVAIEGDSVGWGTMIEYLLRICEAQTWLSAWLEKSPLVVWKDGKSPRASISVILVYKHIKMVAMPDHMLDIGCGAGIESIEK